MKSLKDAMNIIEVLQIPADAVELKDSLYGIVPAESIMNASDLAIYELRDGEARYWKIMMVFLRIRTI